MAAAEGSREELSLQTMQRELGLPTSRNALNNLHGMLRLHSPSSEAAESGH
jgi:hypothetical protein